MTLFTTISKLIRFLKALGLKKGIQTLIKIKSNRTEKISLNTLLHPFKLRSGTSDISTFYQIFVNKEYDINLSFTPSTIIDAGANIGLGAIFFANTYPKAQIITIEPEQSNFDLLKENTKEYKTIKKLNNALSNVSNQDLNIIDNGYGNWGFMTEITTDIKNENANKSIKSITINDIMKQFDYKTIDIVKIDIEGFEKELFETNTEKWLPKTRCLIIELHDHMKKGCSTSFFSAISKYDFSFYQKGENLIFINNN